MLCHIGCFISLLEALKLGIKRKVVQWRIGCVVIHDRTNFLCTLATCAIRVAPPLVQGDPRIDRCSQLGQDLNMAWPPLGQGFGHLLSGQSQLRRSASLGKDPASSAS